MVGCRKCDVKGPRDGCQYKGVATICLNFPKIDDDFNIQNNALV